MHSIFHKIIYRSALGLGLLVRTQLEVKYELATKRLLSYKDVSNLLSNN